MGQGDDLILIAKVTDRTSPASINGPIQYRLGTWNKEDILPSGGTDELKKDMEAAAESLDQRIDSLNESVSREELIEVLRTIDSFYDYGYRYTGYFAVAFYEDGTDQNSTNLDKANEEYYQAEKSLIRFKAWFRDLPPATAEHLIEEAGQYAPWLKNIISAKPFSLPLEREISWQDIKSAEITPAGTEFKALLSNLRIPFRGEDSSLSELQPMAQSEDRDIRRDAALAIETALTTVAPEIFKQLKIIILRMDEERKERGFTRASGQALLESQVPEEAADGMLVALERNFDIYHRYFAAKAAQLGIDDFAPYDVGAPAKDSGSGVGLTYHDVVAATINAAENFHPGFAAPISACFEAEHVLSARDRGKTPQSGDWAFGICPSVAPYTLCLVDNPDQVNAGLIRRVAHELGHVAHFGLRSVLPPILYSESNFLSEVGSLLSEILTAEQLMETNPELTREILAAQVDSLMINIFKAGSLALQEAEVHRLVAEEEGSSFEEVSRRLTELTQAMYGPNVHITPNNHLRFFTAQQLVNMPHGLISYTAGTITALAVYDLLQEARAAGTAKEFANQVVEALAAGGGITPDEFIRKIGGGSSDRSFDITSDEFWERGFKGLKTIVSRLDSLYAN